MRCEVQCLHVLWFSIYFLLARTAHFLSWALSMKCHCARGLHREECTCGRKGNCSPASVPPLLCYLLPSASFYSLSIRALCPGNVPTREGEEEERRGRGEPTCQTGERREKGENSMWCRDRESRLWGRQKTENSFFFLYIWLLPPVINCWSSNWVLRFCWVSVGRERKPTRERRLEKEDGASQWQDGREGKMEEINLKAVLLRNPPNQHLLSSSRNTTSAADIAASLPLSLNTILGSLHCMWKKVESWHLRPAEGNCVPDWRNKTLWDRMSTLTLEKHICSEE